MATTANIGILVPAAFAGQPPTLGEFSEFFRSAEELGFHSLWVIDRVFHPVNIIEPLALLTCAATVTSSYLFSISLSSQMIVTRSRFLPSTMTGDVVTLVGIGAALHTTPSVLTMKVKSVLLIKDASAALAISTMMPLIPRL